MKVKRHNSQAGGFLLLILFMVTAFYLSIKKDIALIVKDTEKSEVLIQVEGETEKPGIYAFKRDTRFQDVLKRAGCSVKETGQLHAVYNQELRSGMKFEISRKGGKLYIKQGEMSAHHKITLNIPISLNKESMIGLTAIPGIGPSLSRRITEERRKKGGFSDLAQLKELPGIGDKLYVNIISYLRL